MHDERAASATLAASLDRIARWQSRRLKQTYADLARSPRYAAAVGFFGTDLYGPGDFSRRDADLARVVPLMSKMLPDAVLATVASAMELSVLSHELDRALLKHLDPAAPLSVASYCDAYRAVDDRASRTHQVELIVSVGRALDRLVAKPLVSVALLAMRQPARVAGLGALQDFLERGFTAFRGMHGAEDFLAIIETRETALTAAIFAGSAAPFPDPEATTPS